MSILFILSGRRGGIYREDSKNVSAKVCLHWAAMVTTMAMRDGWMDDTPVSDGDQQVHPAGHAENGDVVSLDHV